MAGGMRARPETAGGIDHTLPKLQLRLTLTLSFYLKRTDFLGGPRFLWRAHPTNQENAYNEPPSVYTTGREIVTGGVLGIGVRVPS